MCNGIGVALREREAFLEDLLAATLPGYLKSIREARADYKAGRVKTHAEVFGGNSARFDSAEKVFSEK